MTTTDDDDYHGDSGGVSDDGEDSESSSVDSCEAYISFESTRDTSSRLEESISFSWPGIDEDDDDNDGHDDDDDGGMSTRRIAGDSSSGSSGCSGRRRRPRKVVLSTLLEEGDLSPLFDGATWAGTRLWAAAIRAVQYLSGRLPPTRTAATSGGVGSGRSEGDDAIIVRMMTTTETATVDDRDDDNDDGAATKTKTKTKTSILELGCGLGVPGMILHLMGCDVVLTDQPGILSQLERNVAINFGTTARIGGGGQDEDKDEDDGGPRRRRGRPGAATIRAMPLSWSRDCARCLLEDLGRGVTGFDIVVNCDCVYEPLYGKRCVYYVP
jgi:hypothetical protein